jgi:hypothetical protein
MSVHVSYYGDDVHPGCTAGKRFNNGLMRYLSVSIPCDEQFVKEPTTEFFVCEYCSKVFLVHGEIIDYWHPKRKLKV